MKNLIALAVAIISFNPAFAGSMIEVLGTPNVLTASGLDVKVYPEMKVTLPDALAPVSLKLSGAGVRKKKVAFISVNVYVASSYVADPHSLKGGQALEGIKTSPARVIQLTLLRALSGSEIANSFKEALDVNGVDLNDTAVVNVFDQMKFDVKAGNTVTLIGYPKKDGGIEKLVMELPGKTIEEEGKDLSVNFWKVWFGKPVDSGMAALQTALIGN